MGNYSHVVNYVTKGEQTSENTNDKVVAAKLRVCSGLAHLDGKKYKLAARKFLETTVDIGETFNDVQFSHYIDSISLNYYKYHFIFFIQLGNSFWRYCSLCWFDCSGFF